MKTCFFVALLITLDCVCSGTKSDGDDAFECPVKCTTDVYRPVCLRGKSYMNICILKQDICKGKIARDSYKDVEPCPRYKKNEEAAGASVEAIDKNGVIFRNFIDSPKRTESRREINGDAKTKSNGRSTENRNNRRKGRRVNRLKRIFGRIRKPTHSVPKIERVPVFVLAVPCFGSMKLFADGSYMPVIFLTNNRQYTKTRSSDISDEVGPLLPIYVKHHDLQEITKIPIIRNPKASGFNKYLRDARY